MKLQRSQPSLLDDTPLSKSPFHDNVFISQSMFGVVGEIILHYSQLAWSTLLGQLEVLSGDYVKVFTTLV